MTEISIFTPADPHLLEMTNGSSSASSRLWKAAVQKVRAEANERLEKVVAQTGEKAQMFAAACDNQVMNSLLWGEN